jgi:Flagellar basal body L-ring protein
MAEEEKDALKEKANSAFKENLIRLVTVFAYASSVSMAALVLSSYYVFFWEPKPPGPGPPVIHPHAYVSEPYPPLKLMAPPPHGQDTEGASFWESKYWSLF